ncbi:MAG: bifunctional oligoribonuclease/PAP phosphatase NrnA [Anaerolineae bacterium]|jgi:phosphoesterase RecJ-like protein
MNRHLPELAQVNELVQCARRILLIAHVAPDGDAIGSLLGLGALLRARGKEVTLACEDPVPDPYAWLSGSAEVTQCSSGPFDLVISLDCSDERRMGRVFHEGLVGLPLINVDHHVTNTKFGSVNWVDPSSVATAQVVLTLADALDWELTPSVAVCLLTGIVTDTRSFRTSNVDAAAMRAALRLMDEGASLNEITQRSLDHRPLASFRLWGQAIDRLRLQDGILWTEVTRAMRQHWGVGKNGGMGLANFLSGVREADVVLVFTEQDDGVVDVGMRAVPDYDVAQVALDLGGGGHPQASGCTVRGDLPQVRELVLSEVRRSLMAQRAGET